MTEHRTEAAQGQKLILLPIVPKDILDIKAREWNEVHKQCLYQPTGTSFNNKNSSVPPMQLNSIGD